jgi:hypothetical protein
MPPQDELLHRQSKIHVQQPPNPKKEGRVLAGQVQEVFIAEI